MKLVVLLLAGVTIAARTERLITNETKCCEKVKVRILPYTIILLLPPNLYDVIFIYNIGCRQYFLL